MAGHDVLRSILPPSDPVQSTHQLQLEPLPQVVGDARRFVRANAPELPPETADALLLLTSELVTNAVLHARTAIEVNLVIADRSVVVAVHDLDLALRDQNPYPQREGGWGLGLVATLAHSASIDRHPDGGKTSWFRLLRRDAPPVPDAAAARDVDRSHP